ncbi:MAG: YSC84-related protein [Rhodocyclaceae bacterium]
MNKFSICAAIAMSTLIAQPVLAADASKAEKQAQVRKMCEEALATLYKAKPEVRKQVESSAGYGCFSSFGISFLIGGAGGSGLVHDNKAKHDTFMNMGQASAGVDIGIKDYREVLVFRDKATLDKFVSSGWEFSGGAQATAKAGSTGATAETAAAGGKREETKQDPITIYPMTKTGLAIGAAAASRKYWKSDDLN